MGQKEKSQEKFLKILYIINQMKTDIKIYLTFQDLLSQESCKEWVNSEIKISKTSWKG